MVGYRVKFTILHLPGQCHSKPKVHSTEAGSLAQLIWGERLSLYSTLRTQQLVM